MDAAYFLFKEYFFIQNEYGVKTPPFTMKASFYSTLHSLNHNGGGAKPDFGCFLDKISIPAE
ncbi:hypothetical protein AC625_20895 [Peribacillus loiseleuriae]|uniref:Uncharacterized protein n=1 Tax=Peribacillus loiseleuriae TaxID=1679170 RepID=A0A0K9GZH8_9BACI|nr:hypothetical protein AC625_20895 [Peribacillus loiseleuriae]